MTSYKDLPLDVEKYSLSPYLSSRDIASLSSVDKKRKELYDRKYWNKRLEEEEGILLPDYEDDLSPYIRYSRAKKYLEAKRRLDHSIETIDELPDEDFSQLREDVSRYFESIVKYGTPSQVLKASSLASGVIWSDTIDIISSYGNASIIRLFPEYMNEMLPNLLARGDMNIIRQLGVSKHDIMNDLIMDSKLSDVTTKKILDYASTLEGKVGIIGREDADEEGRYYIDLDRRKLMELIQRNYPSLLPDNKFIFHNYLPRQYRR